MKLYLRLTSAFALVAPILLADTSLLSLVGPEANLVVGIRPLDIAESPLVDEALVKAGDELDQLPEFCKQISKEMWAGLDQIVLAGKAEIGADPTKSAGVALARGDFSGSEWQNALCTEGCRQEDYRGFDLQLIEVEGQSAAFAALDERSAAFGSLEHVHRAIDRLLDASNDRDEELLAEVAALSENSFWLVARGPFDFSGQEDVPPMASATFESLAALGFGLSLDDPISMLTEVSATSEPAAAQMFQTLQAFVTMSEGAQTNPPGFLDSLALSRDGTRITAKLQVPLEQLKATLDQSETAASESFRPAPRPKRGQITIHGLRPEPVVVSTTDR